MQFAMSRFGLNLLAILLVQHISNADADGGNSSNLTELDCGPTLFTNTSGLIALPMSPTGYQRTISVNCTYIISANRTSTISINVSAIDSQAIEGSFSNCLNESITVSCSSNNSSASYMYCLSGRSVKPSSPVFTNCRLVTMSIRSQNYSIAELIEFPYAVTDEDDVDCGNTSFAGQNGFITSPHFPLTYQHNLDCVYTLQVGRSNRGLLRFLSFSLDASKRLGVCFRDWLTISCLSERSVSTTNSTSSQRHCGVISPTQTMTFSGCETLSLNFVTDSSITSGGFRIQYTITPTDCGNTSFAGPIGIITSPHFPLTYQHGLNCVYTLQVGRSNSALLRFLSFSLEAATSLGVCSFDWLTISCLSERSVSPTNSTSSQRHCGVKAPTEMMRFSDCETLSFNFVTDHSITSGGFRIQYTITPTDNSTSDVPDTHRSALDCGANEFTNSSGVVTLPTNPTGYRARVNCSYTISTNRTSRISLNMPLTEMSRFLDSFPYCRIDRFKIGCVSERTGDFLSTTLRDFCRETYYRWSNPSSFQFLDCRKLRLSVSSSNYVYIGILRASFSVIANDLDCGNTSFTDPTGIITSPRFPLMYPHSMNCVYSINIGQMKRISLQSLSFDLEGRSNPTSTDLCLHDWLTVRCSIDRSSAINPSAIRKYCGLKLTPLKFSFENCSSLTLNFVTDSSVAGRGFTIHYKVTPSLADNSTSDVPDTDPSDLDCGTNEFTNSSGVFTLPTNPTGYRAKVNCDYTISTNRTSKILLHVPFFEMRTLLDSFQDCSTESLKIGCVSERTGDFLPSTATVFCRATLYRWYMYSRSPLHFLDCRKLRLSVRSSNYVYRGILRASFSVVANDLECGNSSFTDPTGVVTSPRFPLTYPHSLNCFYSIKVGLMKRISLQSLSFHLEGTSNPNSTDLCSRDWLTISCSIDGSSASNPSSNRKYCGLKLSPLKLSFINCSALTLNFVSDASVTYGGFKILYKVTPSPDSFCGASAYGLPSDVINLPWNYTDYGESIDCNYVINATEASSISLTIRSISFQRSKGNNCQRDWLSITCVDGESELDHRVNHRSCNYRNSSTELTFPSCAAVRIVFHGESEATGKTFRIEYTVKGHVNVNTERPTTSTVTARKTNSTRSNCAIGCELSSDATYCECITTASSTFQPETTTVVSEVMSSAQETSETSKSDTTTAIKHTSQLPITTSRASDAAQSSTTTVASQVTSSAPATSDSSHSDTTTAITSQLSITTSRVSDTTQPYATTLASDVISSVPTTSETWLVSDTTAVIASSRASDTTQPDTTTAASQEISSAQITSETSQSDTTTAITTRREPNATQPGTTTVSSDAPITSRTSDDIQLAKNTTSFDAPPISQATECEMICRESIADKRSGCNCSSAQSDEVVVNNQMTHIADRGYSFFIPIAVIIVVIIAVIVAFLWFRARHRSKEDQDMLLKEMESDVAHVGLENGSATTESFVSNSQPSKP